MAALPAFQCRMLALARKAYALAPPREAARMRLRFLLNTKVRPAAASGSRESRPRRMGGAAMNGRRP